MSALAASALAIGFAATVANAQVVCDQNARQPRPIQLGVSGGSIADFLNHKDTACAGGTLGSLVEDTTGDFILSNAHVIARINSAPKGEKIVQPGLEDSNCAKTKRNAVATFNRRIAINFGHSEENTVDCAVASVLPGDVSSTIRNIGPIAATIVTSPSPGLQVQKMGSASCLTLGQISAVNVSATINYSNPVKPPKVPKLANFTGQIMIAGTGFAAPGDSGSLVVTQGACPQAVGLLFAGGSSGVLANPIGTVLKQLAVSFVGGCSVAAAASAASIADSTSGGIASDAVVTAATATRDAHPELMKLPGAVGTGIGLGDHPGQVTIEVYVTKLTPEVQAAAPAAIDGTEVRVIETGPFVAY